MKFKSILVAAIFAGMFSFASCSSNAEQQAESEQQETTVASEDVPQSAESTPATEESPKPEDTQSAINAGFDITTVPVSNHKLGEFPYFVLPEGYEGTSSNQGVKTYDAFMFWTGKKFEMVEGKKYYSNIQAVDKSIKEFSQLEVERSIEQLIKSVGGVKVFSGRIPSDSLHEEKNKSLISKFHTGGNGDIWNDESNVYVVRQPDKEIWIHVCVNRSYGGLTIVEKKQFVQTGKLTKAEEIKKELDSKGQIALYINFDVDKATIKEDSKPIIEELYNALASDAGLKVSIDGHTDNSGTAERNKTLSEERANSVMLALNAKGINPARLKKNGYGQTKPLADNSTEEGKAKNRRVEITKI